MPTAEDNKKEWDGNYAWADRGDEWSEPWGGPFMQWYGAIFPRIKAHLPSANVLEIACGYGRWTDYLKDLCDNLVVIDLSAECIEECKQRFSESSHIDYHVNDGTSLDMISDSSIDFVFSFDSLVHADAGVIEEYISQLPRVLSDDGVAFIHHSNLGEYSDFYQKIRRVPRLEKFLRRLGLIEKSLHWRDVGVDAKMVEALAEKYGLSCTSQELVKWGTKTLFIDCMSTIVKPSSSEPTKNKVLRNTRFGQEIENLLHLSELYDPSKS